MSDTIWKFVLSPGPEGRCTVAMPAPSRLLSVGAQDEAIVVWAIVDPDSDLVEQRHFEVVGTGWPIPKGTYRGTAQFPRLVWHVFELGEESR